MQRASLGGAAPGAIKGRRHAGSREWQQLDADEVEEVQEG